MYRILYVDDEPTLLDICKLFLERNGQYTVDTVENARDAFTLLQKTWYDAIVADYQMPVKNGIQFLQEVRASENKIPFILFTGRGREDVVIEALNSGADFYLQKGGDPASQFAELESKLTQAILRRRAEDTLARNAEKFRTIFDTAPNLILSVNTKRLIVDCNLRVKDVLGLSKDEIIGKKIADFVNVQERGRLNGLLSEVFRGKTVSGWVFRFVKKDHTEVNITLNATALQNRKGEYFRTVCIFNDITKQLQAQSDLLESERKFRYLVESAPDAIFIETNGQYAYVNRAGLALLGAAAPGDLLGKPILDLLNPEDRDVVAGHLKIIHTEKRPVPRREFKITRLDGTPLDVETTAVPFTYEGADSALVFVRDVTARVKDEKSLAENRRVLDTLLSNLPGMAYRCRNDRSWTMEFVSDGCRALTGYAPEDLVGNAKVSYGSLIVPKDREQVWIHVQEGIRTHKPFLMHYAITDARGKTKNVWEQGRGVFDEKGDLITLEGYIFDINVGKGQE